MTSRSQPHPCSGVVAAVIVAVLVLWWPTPALAHSFLVRSTPAPGSRLTTAPRELTLQFSEPLDTTPTIELVDGNDRPVQLAGVVLDDGATRADAAVPPLADGVYQVTWRVTALDGHTTEGEFAFAVGEKLPAGATLVSTSRAVAEVSWLDGLTQFALIAGIAVALGGLVSERWLWQGRPAAKACVVPGTAAATVGGLGILALRLDRRGALVHVGRWGDALSARSDRLILGATVSCIVAALLALHPLLRRAAIGWVAIGAVAVVAAGHAADSPHWWTQPATAVHVLAAGIWIGALVHLARSARLSSPLEGPARRHSHTAAAAVAVAIPLGVATLAGIVDRPLHVFSGMYGRILAVKLAFVAGALGIAFAARRSALPATEERTRRLARLTALEVLVVAGVVASSAVLATTGPSTGRSILLGPAPLPEPVVWRAELAGSYEVAAGAAAGELRIIVTPPDERAETVEIDVTASEPDGADVDLEPRPCGPGCGHLARSWQNGTTTLTVTVASGQFAGGTAKLDIDWPPSPDASALLEQVIAATRAAPTMTIEETVVSGPDAVSGPASFEVDGRRYIAAQPYAGGADDVRRLPDDAGFAVLAFRVTGAETYHQLWIDDADRIRRAVVVSSGARVDDAVAYPHP